MNAFWKKLGHLTSEGPEILAFGSHSSANFQPILDCFILNFKLKYENTKKIKEDRVNTVVFMINFSQIKRGTLLGHPVQDSFSSFISGNLSN